MHITHHVNCARDVHILCSLHFAASCGVAMRVTRSLRTSPYIHSTHAVYGTSQRCALDHLRDECDARMHAHANTSHL